MPKTLVLLFHHDLNQSKANAALVDAAGTVETVEVIDMQVRYPHGLIDMFTDGEREAQMLLGADRIVLQFPVQWYSTPALLKIWQDAVLTRMYYVFAETEGDRLAGTSIMIAATLGNKVDAYSREGQNHYSVDEIFTPLKATAHRCGLVWHEPYLVFTADKLDNTELQVAANRYAQVLKKFIAITPQTKNSEVA